MHAPLKRHVGENGEATRYSFSVELIVGLVVLLGGGSMAGGYITFGGIGASQVESVMEEHTQDMRGFVKAVIHEEESTFTLEELAVRDAQMDRERQKEAEVQGQITKIESDVGKLKTDVSDISSVQKTMARDVEKLVEAIPDP